MNKILDVSEKQKAALPTTHYENPWLEAASEASNDFGRLLKFVKGKFECGDDEIPLGTEFVAHVDQIARGWIRFEEGKVLDRMIGKIADGFRPLQQEQLPDNDPKSWTEKDTKGEPRDPWVGSKGGVAAVSNLCRVYGRRHRDGLVPIVALRINSYKHKQYGRIETPDLPIVGWEGAPTVMPAQAAADDLNDAIPF